MQPYEFPDTVSIDSALKIHNVNSDFHIYYELTTPVHLIVMYNTCGLPNITNNFFSVSPAGAHYLTRSSSDPSPSKLHRHNYFELLIVLEGSILQEIEGKEYLYSAGSCCLINRNVTHTEHFLEKGTIVFLGLSMDFVRELIADCDYSFFAASKTVHNSVFTFMEDNLDSNSQKYYLDFFPIYQNCVITDTLRRISDSMIRTLFLPKLGASYTIKGLIYELIEFIDAEENFHTIPVKVNSKNDFLLFSRIRHLMEDTNGRMPRSGLEAALHYSGNYLNTIVRQYTGMCLFDYGMEFCLQKAADLFVSTDMSITAVIESLHFSNCGHFYKLFKEKYGMLPKEYRKKMRK